MYIKKNTIIMSLCLLMYMLIVCVPVIDYYCQWYITVIPLIIVLLHCGCREDINNVGKIILGAIIYSLLSFWFVYRDYDFLDTFINTSLLWVPAIYAYKVLPSLDNCWRKRLLQTVSVLLLITSITTIVGLSIFPSASRELASGNLIYNTDIYSKINIGGFGFIYGLVCFVPIQMWIIKNTRSFLKIVNIAIHLVFFYTIIQSKYTSALLLFIVLSIFCIFRFSKKRFVITCAISIFVITVLRSVVIWFLEFIQTFSSDYVDDRIQQLIQVLSLQTVSTQTTTTRIDYYRDAIVGFFDSPIWGNCIFGFNKVKLQGHSTILDILYTGGIIYLALFICIVIYLIKKSNTNCKYVSDVFIQGTISFFLVAIVNPVSHTALPFFILLICGVCVNFLEEPIKE